jgi:hypothetical protein
LTCTGDFFTQAGQIEGRLAPYLNRVHPNHPLLAEAARSADRNGELRLNLKREDIRATASEAEPGSAGQRPWSKISA